MSLTRENDTPLRVTSLTCRIDGTGWMQNPWPDPPPSGLPVPGILPHPPEFTQE